MSPATHDATGAHTMDPICPSGLDDCAHEGHGVLAVIQQMRAEQRHGLLDDTARLRLIRHLATEGAHVTPCLEHLGIYKEILRLTEAT